ncbi:MAG: response regulator [Sphaerochaetaceae bacterium]|nr:response regulator [Sphaerochaetaceae bacterium]
MNHNLTQINEDWTAKDTASDGIYAINLLQNNIYDVVITDIKMPTMDGIELSKYLYKNQPQTPIIIISGYDEFEYARAAVKLNVFDYILKPLRDEELSAALSTISLRRDYPDTDSIKSIERNKNTLVSQIQEYLQLHFREGLSLTILADIFNITPSYLSTIFHKEIGEPYSKYLLRMRMETAKAILSNPNYKVQDVALDVGFSSSKHFGSVFKSYYGISPGEFKNNTNINR